MVGTRGWVMGQLLVLAARAIYGAVQMGQWGPAMETMELSSTAAELLEKAEELAGEEGAALGPMARMEARGAIWRVREAATDLVGELAQVGDGQARLL